MNITTYLNNCRICKNDLLEDIIFIGEQYITSRFPKYGDFSTPKTNITLCLCSNCGLVQLKETTNCSELYEYEYGYRSGISNTMINHLKLYQEEILEKISSEKISFSIKEILNFSWPYLRKALCKYDLLPYLAVAK